MDLKGMAIVFVSYNVKGHNIIDNRTPVWIRNAM